MIEQLKFELQSCAISEIVDESKWVGDGVARIDDSIVSEITSGDEKPFYVEFVALYEGVSRNGKVYSADAVRSCPEAMLGVNMYKGHEEPGTESWKYREPVGRIVAAKIEQIDVGGKSVLAAKGKAYITDTDHKLRSDIKKKMAGNVSILGNARMVRNVGEVHKTVTFLHKPLKSVDFCNPGTNGLPHAGVTAVVSEMADDVVVDGKKDHQMTKLTKDQLLTEYKTEITSLVGEQTEAQIQEIASQRRLFAEEKEKFKDEKLKYDSQIAEMKASNAALVVERDDWKRKSESERDARLSAELTVFAATAVSEMKANDDLDEKIVEMASKRVKPSLIEGDLEKSKTAFSAALKASIDELVQLAEMYGGGSPVETGEKPTKKHSNNPGNKGGEKLSRFLSPDLVEARKKRIGASA